MYGADMKNVKDFFNHRTHRHINLVQKYAQRIAELHPELAGVIEQAASHDASKYEDPEYEPYLHITWDYKCKDEGKSYQMPSHIDGNAATLHHIKSNRHHPEYHDEGSGEDSLNREDRDAIPDRPTDATGMSDIDIAEMVADWCAMSEEKGGHPKDWAEKNVNVRWKFTDDQSDLIYNLIDSIFRG
jgi:hypothetical protein